MAWIHRHNRCVGLVLFRFGKHQAELWYCPHGEEIKPHVHQKIDSTLVILGGGMDGKIGERHGIVEWNDFLRRFHIPAGVVHSAKITGRFCLFLNLERWTGTPTSAAIDFKKDKDDEILRNARSAPYGYLRDVTQEGLDDLTK